MLFNFVLPLALLSGILIVPRIVYGYYDPKLISVTKCLGIVCWSSLLTIPHFFMRRRIYLTVVSIILLLFTACQILHGPFAIATLFVVFETNLPEAMEFAGMYFTMTRACILLLVAGAFSLSLSQIRIIAPPFRTKLILLTVAILTFVPFAAKAIVSDYTSFARPFTQLSVAYRDYKQEIDAYRSESDRRRRGLLEISAQPSNTEDGQTYVVIIGESTNRNHMSIHGYPRRTNPKLASIEQELIVFSDVICSRSYTLESLKHPLTFAS